MSRSRNQPPLIFIVEDHGPQRRNLHEALEDCGFEVWSAGDVATARSHVQELGDRIDVALLDMQLEDPAAPGIYGTDIGFEIRRGQATNLTEFLILTAHPDLDFKKHALRLGAAAYLRKPMPIPEVIHHIRSLAFRRQITASSIPTSKKSRRIVETSFNRNHALARYCQEIMSPTLEWSLGSPTLLLCSDQYGTRLCGGSIRLDELDSRGLFHTVASLAFGRSGTQEPYAIDAPSFPPLKKEQEQELLEELDGGCVVTLAEIRDFRLSAVLKRGRQPEEDPEKLGSIFAGYARSAVTTQLLGVATLWAEMAAHRRTLLAATSRMCLYLGQRQKSLLDKVQGGHLGEAELRELQDLGEDLHTAGQLLADLDEDVEAGEPLDAPSHERVDVIRLVNEVWGKLSDAADLPLDLLHAEGDCVVHAGRSDLSIVIRRILRWLVQRLPSGAQGPKPIAVSCQQDAEGTRITFRDASRRLPLHLREHVFLPFEEADQSPMRPQEDEPDGAGALLSLYLARALVEVRSGGYLEDQTEDLEDEDGHLLVMGLPIASGLVAGQAEPNTCHL